MWPLAFSTATYLINRLPTPTLQNQSPFSRLFNKVPNYSKLPSFGCLCYPWLRPYNSHKLQPKSTPCIFVGYSSTQSAYHCLDPVTHKIYTSRHVRFFENEYPYSSLTPNITTDNFSSDINTWTNLCIPLLTHKHTPSSNNIPTFTSNSPSTNNQPTSPLNRTPPSPTSIISTPSAHTNASPPNPHTNTLDSPIPHRQRKPNTKYFNSDYVLQAAIQSPISKPTNILSTLKHP